MSIKEWNSLTDANRKAITRYWAKITHPTFGPVAIEDFVREFAKKYHNKSECKHGPINVTKITSNGTANITLSFIVGLQLPIYTDEKTLKKCLK